MGIIKEDEEVTVTDEHLLREHTTLGRKLPF